MEAPTMSWIAPSWLTSGASSGNANELPPLPLAPNVLRAVISQVLPPTSFEMAISTEHTTTAPNNGPAWCGSSLSELTYPAYLDLTCGFDGADTLDLQTGLVNPGCPVVALDVTGSPVNPVLPTLLSNEIAGAALTGSLASSSASFAMTLGVSSSPFSSTWCRSINSTWRGTFALPLGQIAGGEPIRIRGSIQGGTSLGLAPVRSMIAGLSCKANVRTRLPTTCIDDPPPRSSLVLVEPEIAAAAAVPSKMELLLLQQRQPKIQDVVTLSAARDPSVLLRVRSSWASSITYEVRQSLTVMTNVSGRVDVTTLPQATDRTVRLLLPPPESVLRAISISDPDSAPLNLSNSTARILASIFPNFRLRLNITEGFPENDVQMKQDLSAWLDLVTRNVSDSVLSPTAVPRIIVQDTPFLVRTTGGGLLTVVSPRDPSAVVPNAATTDNLSSSWSADFTLAGEYTCTQLLGGGIGGSSLTVVVPDSYESDGNAVSFSLRQGIRDPSLFRWAWDILTRSSELGIPASARRLMGAALSLSGGDLAQQVSQFAAAGALIPVEASCPSFCPGVLDEVIEGPLGVEVVQGSTSSGRVSLAQQLGLSMATVAIPKTSVLVATSASTDSETTTAIITNPFIGGVLLSKSCVDDGFADPFEVDCSDPVVSMASMCAYRDPALSRKCVACPKGAVCPTEAEIRVLPGYDLTRDGVTGAATAVECAYPATDRCLGFSVKLGSSACGVGYSNLLPGCATCAAGYYTNADGSCGLCPGDGTITPLSWSFIRPIFIFVGIMAAVATAIFIPIYSVARKERVPWSLALVTALCFLASCLLIFQSVSQVASTVRNFGRLPLSLQRFLTIFRFLQFENLGNVSPECVEGDRSPFYWTEVAIIFVSVLALVTGIFALVCQSRLNRVPLNILVSTTTGEVVEGAAPKVAGLTLNPLRGNKGGHTHATTPGSAPEVDIDSPRTASISGSTTPQGARVIEMGGDAVAISKSVRVLAPKVISFSVLILALAYSYLSNSIFGLLHCSDVLMKSSAYVVLATRALGYVALPPPQDPDLPTGMVRASVLVEDPSLLCNIGDHQRAYSVAVLGLVVFLIGFPLAAFVWMSKITRTFWPSAAAAASNHLYLVFHPFERSTWICFRPRGASILRKSTPSTDPTIGLPESDYFLDHGAPPGLFFFKKAMERAKAADGAKASANNPKHSPKHIVHPVPARLLACSRFVDSDVRPSRFWFPLAFLGLRLFMGLARTFTASTSASVAAGVTIAILGAQGILLLLARPYRPEHAFSNWMFIFSIVVGCFIALLDVLTDANASNSSVWGIGAFVIIFGALMLGTVILALWYEARSDVKEIGAAVPHTPVKPPSSGRNSKEATPSKQVIVLPSPSSPGHFPALSRAGSSSSITQARPASTRRIISSPAVAEVASKSPVPFVHTSSSSNLTSPLWAQRHGSHAPIDGKATHTDGSISPRTGRSSTRLLTASRPGLGVSSRRFVAAPVTVNRQSVRAAPQPQQIVNPVRVASPARAVKPGSIGKPGTVGKPARR